MKKIKTAKDKNGNIHWYKINKAPILTEDNEIMGLVTIAKKFATINSNTRKGNRSYNEMYGSNPQVMGAFAYKWQGSVGNPLKFLENNSHVQFLKEFAMERDFPFIVFGD